MKHVNVIVVCAIFWLLQLLLAPRIALGAIAPDFALVLVAYFALTRGVISGSVAGFVIGFILDVYSPETLGYNSLAMSIAGYAIAIGGSKGDEDNLPFLAALFGLAALCHDFIYLLAFTRLHPGKFLILFVTVAIPSSIYTAAIGVIAYRLVSRIGGKAVKSLGKA